MSGRHDEEDDDEAAGPAGLDPRARRDPCRWCAGAHDDWRDCPKLKKRRGSRTQPSGGGQFVWFFPPPRREWAIKD